jgi:hypothetical protein
MRLTPLDAGDQFNLRKIAQRSPSLAAKAFIAKVRPELISARFLLSRYFRLF